MAEDDNMYTYTVYKNPRDYPGKYVVRRWQVVPCIAPDAKPFAIEETYDKIQKQMEELGLYKMTRMPDDDPAILEVWI